MDSFLRALIFIALIAIAGNLSEIVKIQSNIAVSLASMSMHQAMR